MVRGSGSHVRGNHGSGSRRGAAAQARTSERVNLGSNTRNSAASRTSASASARANHSSSTTHSATTRRSGTVNHGSGARNSSTARASASASASATARANHGSSTRNSATARADERANHGNSIRNAMSATFGGRANNDRSARNDTSATTRASERTSNRSDSRRGEVSQTRDSQRANHGSSTRNCTSTTTRESHRADHRSSTRTSASARMRDSTTRNAQTVHHRERNSDGVYREDYEDEQRGWLLCRAFGCFFQCLGAVLLAILCCGYCQKPVAEDTAATTANSNQRNRNGNDNDNDNHSGGMPTRSPCLWSIPVGFLVSSLLFLVLVQNSGNSVSTSSVALGSMNNVETLFAGQTLRIVPPFSFLTQKFRVSVARYPPTSQGISADVFWSSSKCPSLTGTKVKLQHDSESDLQPNSYVWDHYNFNPGSRMSGEIYQLSGTTCFYLLKGAHALEEVEKGKAKPDYLEDNAEVKFCLSSGSSRKFQYDTPYWWATDYGDNVYTLVYDNPSEYSDSSFDVDIDITMTTHDMRKFGNPVCDHLGHYGDNCPFSPKRSDCIVVKAFLDNDKDDHKVDETAEIPLETDSDSDRSISLEVEFYRDWRDISLYSAIPLFVSIFVCFFASLCSVLVCVFLFMRRWILGQNENEDDEGDLTEPLLSQEDDEGDTTESFFPSDGGEVEDCNWDRPPPTAPQSIPEATLQPSAPIKDDVIIVPPESVEVV